MDGNVIYIDEYLKIYISGKDVMAETYRKGFNPELLLPALEKHPQAVITGMNMLRSMLITAPAGPRKIGEFRDKIHLDISVDFLTATVTFYMTKEELSLIPREP